MRPGASALVISLTLAGCAHQSAASYSGVIPLRTVVLGQTGVVMSFPLADVRLELREGARQRVHVLRPFAFETEVYADSLPWVVRGPVSDHSGVVGFGDQAHELSALRREADQLVVEAALDEEVSARELELPLSAVGLQARDRDVYIADRFELLSWGSTGRERLAQLLLLQPRSPPLDPSFTPVAHLEGSEVRMRGTPDWNAASVRLSLRSSLELEVLEHGPVWSRVRSIRSGGTNLVGWVSTPSLFALAEAGARGVEGSRAGDGPGPYLPAVEPAVVTPESPEALFEGPAAIRSGAPLFDGPDGQQAGAFFIERQVKVRARKGATWVELIGFPDAFNPIRIVAGRLFVRSEDVVLNGVKVHGVMLEGASPWDAPATQAEQPWRVRAVDAAPWKDVFQVGDELVRMEDGKTQWTFPGTDARGVQGHFEFLAPQLFFAASSERGAGHQRQLVLRRGGQDQRQVLGLRSGHDIADTRDTGFLEFLQKRCAWQQAAWHCP